jgi:anti-anti-sigma factor
VRTTCTIALSSITIHTKDLGGVPVVEVTGEIDRTNSGSVLAVLTSQLDSRPRGLVVDLTGTLFFDSSGVKVLVLAAARAAERGITMAVVADRGVVLRPLAITGAAEAVDLRPTLDLALAAVGADASR